MHFLGTLFAEMCYSVVMIDKNLIEKLRKVTKEEEAILSGDNTVQMSLYSGRGDFVIESERMLQKGKLIDIRPHTRYVHFPKHRHDYIEIIYMCSGHTINIIDNNVRIDLKEGELLFLNQNATQEILPAGSDDIAVNFIVLPQFFDTAFDMLRDESILRDFLIGTLSSNNTMGNYLHFQVSDILPVQNLLENMIWALVNDQQSRRNINQTTMGLLLMQLVGYTDRLSSSDPNQYEQNLVFTCLKYIEENYKTATLTELSGLVSMPDYQLSRFIRQHAGGTFKELLQRKRLNQAAFLLSTTKLPVEHIISVVGYDNTSYFHRIFRSHFGMSPKDYRLEYSS